MSSTAHWEAVYDGRATEELGWYEPRPSTLDLVLRFSAPTDAVIDVGAGDSRLVDELLHAGYEQITVLDLSETALRRAQARLGPASGNVSWIRGDVTSWTPPRRWDLWHDRAVFHFLVRDEDQQEYKAAALQSLSAGGRMIVATFAPDGPERAPGSQPNATTPRGWQRYSPLNSCSSNTITCPPAQQVSGTPAPTSPWSSNVPELEDPPQALTGTQRPPPLPTGSTATLPRHRLTGRGVALQMIC